MSTKNAVPKGATTLVLTPEQIAALSLPDLVATYNSLTGKSIKRFSSRAAGEKQVLKAQQSKNFRLTPAPPTGSPPATQVRVRTVRGKASAGATGRPIKDFTIQLTPTVALSSPHKGSLRRQLIELLETHPDRKALLSAIDARFKRPMASVVRKLEERKWLRRLGTGS